MRLGATTSAPTLDEISLSRNFPGELFSRRELWRQLVHRSAGWAVFIACVQDCYSRGWELPKFHLSKWKKENGMWNREESFIIREDYLPVLAHVIPQLAQQFGSDKKVAP